AGLLHPDVKTINGTGLDGYTAEPKLDGTAIRWQPGARDTLNDRILRPASDPFAPTSGLKQLSGNLGRGVIKISAVAPERHIIQAPARVFGDQEQVKAAFKAGEFTQDTVVVVRFQGPRANGMPELHSLTPTLSVLQDRGLRVALLTDGRMSGASGKVPAAIHIAPEAANGGPLAKIRDGDIIRMDAVAGTIDCLTEGWDTRAPAAFDPAPNSEGMGRELFAAFRAVAGSADTGACSVV
ncbi:MAG: dihydroxy-acid dehydratase, partial [Paracoccus sp. (in: a-proteobacteria)]|nr:dihydroxy-acid dehydratase [Paracoccus sp. (in: a-proteobacteria)]